MTGRTDLTGLSGRMLAWFDREARDLPWRTRAGEPRDPYRVWLSEVMLQQTTVPHAIPYFLKFIERWPSVDALSEAADDEVMSAWAGLGYYARARNLLKCARAVNAAGGFPGTEAELRSLPGVGPYTAGAIAAIAFGQRSAAVDGNVERVFARLLALKGDWKDQKRRISDAVKTCVPQARPGDFAEALMDLGATICTPKRPNCLNCPLKGMCLASARGAPETFPVKPKKAVQPKRFGIVYVLTDRSRILLERRPDSGLLGGMLGLPTSEWCASAAPVPAPPADVSWRLAGEVRHVFTHFDLRLDVFAAEGNPSPQRGEWMPRRAADGLPTVFAKALRVGLDPVRLAKRR